MIKKEYIQPALTIVSTQIEASILAGSGPETDDKTGNSDSNSTTVPNGGTGGTGNFGTKENFGDNSTWDNWE